MDLFKQIQGIDYTLAGSGVNLSDTSVTLDSFTTPDGTQITASDIGAFNYFTFEPGTAKEEQGSFTGLTINGDGSTTLTGVTRGLKFVEPYDQDLNLRQSHAGGSILRLSNTAAYYNEFGRINDDNVWNGGNIFPEGGSSNAPKSGTFYAVPVDNLEYTSKEYVDDQIGAVVAGALPAFAVSQDGPDPSLNITVNAGEWMLGNELFSFAGQSGIALTPSSTNYIMLNRNNSIEVNTSGFITTDYLAIAEVSTDATDITGIVDRRTFMTIGVDDQTITTAYLYGDTIAIGDVLYLDTADAKWKLASGTVSTTSDNTYGIALDAGFDTNPLKRVQIAGRVATVTGLTTAGIQYVSNTAGNVSNTPGTYKKMIGFSPDGSTMIINPVQRVNDLAGTNSDTTTANLNEAMTFFSISNMTGAQSNTLVAGPTSNADALHTHEFRTIGINKSRTYFTYQFPMITATAGGVSLAGQWVSSVPGNATSTGVSIQLNGASGSEASHALWYPSGQNSTLSWDDNKITVVEWAARVNINPPAGFAGWGLSSSLVGATVFNDANSTTDTIGFCIDSTGTLRSKTSNTVSVTTNIITGITLSDFNFYRIEFNSTLNTAAFYVNNLLKFTHSTNIPISSGIVNLLFAHASNQGSIMTIPTIQQEL